MRKLLSSLIRWFFALNFIFFALGTGIIGEPRALLSCGMFTLGAIILIPGSAEYLQRAIHKEFSLKLIILLPLALFVVGCILYSYELTKYDVAKAVEKTAIEEKRKEKAEENARNIEQFQRERTEIVDTINGYLENSEYESALLLVKKYLFTKDEEITLLHTKVREAVARKKTLLEVEQLEAEAANTPASEFQGSIDIYRKLLKLDPDNEKYQSKIEDYSAKKTEAESLAREAANQEKENDRTRDILAELKSIPASQYRKNKKLYTELVKIHPDNQKYRQKLEHYSEQLEAQLREEQLAKSSGMYFFTANDAVITKCLHTDLSRKEDIEKQLEAAFGVNCDAIEDKDQTVIVTCKATLTNMTFAAKTEKTCNSLRASVKQMTGS